MPSVQPIAPFETSWSTTGDDSGHEARHQVPLALCWSITMHMSQGQTMDKAVVDLGKSESTAGLTFVCLSRAKRLVDLLIEPMAFKRLSKLGDKPITFQLRLPKEEAPSSSRWGDTTPPRECSVMSAQIYVCLVRRRVETPTPYYTNTCVKLTIVTHLSFSERIAIANLFLGSRMALTKTYVPQSSSRKRYPESTYQRPLLPESRGRRAEEGRTKI